MTEGAGDKVELILKFVNIRHACKIVEMENINMSIGVMCLYYVASLDAG